MKFGAVLFWILFSLLPRHALAMCDNPDRGTSKLFSVSIYVVGGCNPNDQFPEGTKVIEFAELPAGNVPGAIEGPTQTVRFSDECTLSKKGFSCIKVGRSPLAGTTYTTTKDMKDVCDETGKGLVNRLTCTKGCQDGRAPKYIEGEPWEC